MSAARDNAVNIGIGVLILILLAYIWVRFGTTALLLWLTLFVVGLGAYAILQHR